MNVRITIAKSSGNDFVLVDWGDMVLESVVPEFQSDLQVVKYLRGDQIEVIDQSNGQTRWDLTVVKEWAKLADAIAWHNDVRNLCPRVGTVMKAERDYSGAAVNRWLRNAGIGVRSLPRIGLATFTQVTVLGGLVLNARPTS